MLYSYLFFVPFVERCGRCYFPQGTSQTYFWDNSCQLGLDACYADGVHEQCRYCGSGSGGAYEHIPCPVESQPFVLP